MNSTPLLRTINPKKIIYHFKKGMNKDFITIYDWELFEHLLVIYWEEVLEQSRLYREEYYLPYPTDSTTIEHCQYHSRLFMDLLLQSKRSSRIPIKEQPTNKELN